MGTTRKTIIDALRKRGIVPAYVGIGRARNRVLERAVRKLEAGEKRASKFTLAQRRELGEVARDLTGKSGGKKKIPGFIGLQKKLIAWRKRETALAKKHHPNPLTPEAREGRGPVETLRRRIYETDGGVRVFWKQVGNPFEQRWTTDGFFRFVSLPQYRKKWDKVFGGGRFYFSRPAEDGSLPEGARPARFERPT